MSFDVYRTAVNRGTLVSDAEANAAVLAMTSSDTERHAAPTLARGFVGINHCTFELSHYIDRSRGLGLPEARVMFVTFANAAPVREGFPASEDWMGTGERIAISFPGLPTDPFKGRLLSCAQMTFIATASDEYRSSFSDFLAGTLSYIFGSAAIGWRLTCGPTPSEARVLAQADFVSFSRNTRADRPCMAIHADDPSAPLDFASFAMFAHIGTRVRSAVPDLSFRVVVSLAGISLPQSSDHVFSKLLRVISAIPRGVSIDLTLPVVASGAPTPITIEIGSRCSQVAGAIPCCPVCTTDEGLRTPLISWPAHLCRCSCILMMPSYAPQQESDVVHVPAPRSVKRRKSRAISARHAPNKLSFFPLSELSAICRVYGLPTSGTKTMLSDRIADHILDPKRNLVLESDYALRSALFVHKSLTLLPATTTKEELVQRLRDVESGLVAPLQAPIPF